ncbi:MAG: phosphatase PAP2 family protein [Jatrophihabitantaceae bacterium]
MASRLSLAGQRPFVGPRLLAGTRWVAIATWVIVVGSWVLRDGLSYDRNSLLLVICTGLIATTIGRRRSLTVIRDWLPFAAVLLVYDLSRGAATLLGRPTEWHLQLDADRALFLGHEPTVWLQSHLKQPQPPWWETGVSLVYVSFFFAPYVAAGVLWLRDRADWRKFVLRFVVISFIGLVGFVAFPAAPPWAASLCQSSQVAGGPSDPPCIEQQAGAVKDGGMLGQVKLSHAGAAPWVERISTRGWDKLGVPQAKALIDEGQAGSNEVAAVPSLHAAISLLITVFFWPRLRKRWRPLLAGYALVMAFSLVYSAEHYVFDILIGWLLTGLVSYGFYRWENRRGAGRGDAAGRPAAATDPAGDQYPVQPADTLDGSLLTRP